MWQFIELCTYIKKVNTYLSLWEFSTFSNENKIYDNQKKNLKNAFIWFWMRISELSRKLILFSVYSILLNKTYQILIYNNSKILLNSKYLVEFSKQCIRACEKNVNIKDTNLFRTCSRHIPLKKEHLAHKYKLHFFSLSCYD